MRKYKNDEVDVNVLIKKYKCDIRRIIKLWKKGKNDFEISQSLGLDMFKIIQIRQDLACLHEKARQRKLKTTSPFKSGLIDKT